MRGTQTLLEMAQKRMSEQSSGPVEASWTQRSAGEVLGNGTLSSRAGCSSNVGLPDNMLT